MYATAAIAKIIVPMMTGKNAGSNSQNQLEAVQVSSMGAFGWNARIAINAIDKSVPGQARYPRFIDSFDSFFSIVCMLYKSRKR